jgi:hypothetical protein
MKGYEAAMARAAALPTEKERRHRVQFLKFLLQNNPLRFLE